MAREAFCTTCQRTVYMSNGDSHSCPVCSSPLVDQASEPASSTDDGASATA